MGIEVEGDAGKGKGNKEDKWVAYHTDTHVKKANILICGSGDKWEKRQDER